MMWLVSLIAGTVFGAGLTISGMVNPQKILNFLDFAAIPTGGWDPTLAVVFASAVGVMALTYLFLGRISSPVIGRNFFLPTRRDIDIPLVAGSVIFGIGWGLAGICPGPAIAALSIAKVHLADFAIFVGALASGIILRMITRARAPASISRVGARA